MEAGFRASMNWLHTWFGVVLGGLLFAIFWMGTLSVFDHEIDRWMAPATRLPMPESSLSLETLRPLYEAASAAEASRWVVEFPTKREPTIHVFWSGGSASSSRFLDPASGVVLPDSGTLAGTGFLYPFHYMLHVGIWRIGTWIVGLASMAMLALCLSGVVIHRKIFADFFTFRRKRKSRRVILDLHNVLGVLGLPFHVAIVLSGLIAFYWIYFPGGVQAVYGDNREAFYKESYGSFERPKLDRPAGAASMDVMVDETERLWGGATPRTFSIRHPGDAGAYAAVSRSSEDRITSEPDVAYFDVATGRLLHHRTNPRPIMATQHFIAGMHLIRFENRSLRWLYFVLGLAGCATIATGYLFWLEARRNKHQQQSHLGVRSVEGLTIGSVTGILLATLAFFVANRLLPLGVAFAGIGRAALEVWVFYVVWLATFAHAGMRPSRAWVEQCRAIALLAVAAVLLNWITTGDHLIRSLSHRHLWPIAGMDLLLMAGAGLAALVAHKLERRAAQPPARRARSADSVAQAAE